MAMDWTKPGCQAGIRGNMESAGGRKGLGEVGKKIWEEVNYFLIIILLIKISKIAFVLRAQPTYRLVKIIKLGICYYHPLIIPVEWEECKNADWKNG